MALVAASVASGTPAAPVEVLGAEPAGPAPEGPGQAVLDQLRPLMRQVVLTGTATALADRGEVYGKTGTAEFGSNTPPDSHGWFMGYQLAGPQGDIAFAVLVEAGQSSSAAVGVTDAFLGNLG
jgi:cell division protein FtsI/penicillin-binding protein 2